MWFLLLFVLPEVSIHKQIQATIKLFKKKKTSRGNHKSVQSNFVSENVS